MRSLLRRCTNFSGQGILPTSEGRYAHIRNTVAIGRSRGSLLEDEIESWEGFPSALRKEDRDLWDQMIESEATLNRSS